ncbi:hypothetical protein MMC27_003968 [Xylographa pallens]|nr:hypothetical protein [Xylographa pallens]
MPYTPWKPCPASGRLGGVLGTETISLFVGPERKQYVVHKRLLCDTVPYFSKLLDGPFVESKADHVALDDEIEDPIAVELFCHWLYRGSLPNISEESNQKDLLVEKIDDSGVLAAEIPYHHLYYMADKWCMTLLKNQTMDCIKYFHDHIGQWVHPQLIVQGFEHTPTNSPLRRYLTESAACLCLNKESNPDTLVALTEAIGPQSQDIWPAMLDVIKNKMLTAGIEMDDPDLKDNKAFHDPVS